MKKLITAIAAALLVPSFGAIASGIPVFDGAAETTRQTFHLADTIFTATVDLAQRAQQSINEVNATVESANRAIQQSEAQFKQTIENTTGMFSTVFDDILKKNVDAMKKSIESSSKELADAFNYGAKSVVQSVSKEKIMAWWKASGSEEICGGDGTEAKSTQYEKYCAAITMADATFAAKMEDYNKHIQNQMEQVNAIRQQVASGGMTQKQMQDAQVTLATMSALINLDQQAIKAYKEQYAAKRAIAARNAQLKLNKEPPADELKQRFAKSLTFSE